MKMTNTSHKITVTFSIYIVSQNTFSIHILVSFITLSFINPVFINVFINPAHIYLFKFNNRNSRKRFDVCSKLT